MEAQIAAVRAPEAIRRAPEEAREHSAVRVGPTVSSGGRPGSDSEERNGIIVAEEKCLFLMKRVSQVPLDPVADRQVRRGAVQGVHRGELSGFAPISKFKNLLGLRYLSLRPAGRTR